MLFYNKGSGVCIPQPQADMLKQKQSNLCTYEISVSTH